MRGTLAGNIVGAILGRRERLLAQYLGFYRIIVQNDHLSLFPAPHLGFFAKARPESGIDGVYFPADENDEAYLWEYLLKNKKRSFSSPTNQQVLSVEHDQPKRALFLDAKWYQSKGSAVLGRTMIDTDFKVDRSLLQSISVD
jgi:hypothetical protein